MGTIPWEKFGSLLLREGRLEPAMAFFARAAIESGQRARGSDLEERTAGQDLFAAGRLDEAAAWYGLERVDRRPIDLAADAVICCAAVRNEAHRLPFFLAHYRRLGVRAFFVVDNASTDSTVDLLVAEPDVHLWRTSGSFKTGRFGSAWFQVLLERHAPGRWCVIVDADEVLCYARSETRSLPALCADLDRRGKTALTAVLLDMYSDRPIAETRCDPGQDPLEVCPFFERAWFHYRHTLAGPRRNQTHYRGGLRRRVFGAEAAETWLNKAPLIKYVPGTLLYPGQHWAHAPAAEVADETGCLLHFKYMASFPAYATREAARKEHAGGAAEYAAYARALEQDPGLVLYDARHSVRLTGGSGQLIALGVIQEPSEAREAIACERAPAQAPRTANRAAAPDRPARGPRHLSSRTPAPVLIFTDCPRTFGAEQATHAVAVRLAREGHRVAYAQSIADHALIAARAALGIEPVWLGFDTIADALDGFVRASASFDEAERIFLATRPGAILFADGCCFSSLAAKETAARMGIPYAVVIHRDSPGPWPQGVPEPVAAAARGLERARAVVAVCAQQLAAIRERFGIPLPQGEVIYHGRGPEYFAPRDEAARARVRRSLGIRDDEVIAFTSARLDPEKGFHFQLEAMRLLEADGALDRLVFLWAGTGLHAGSLEYLRSLGVGARVRLLGLRSDIPDLLDASDLFLLPSKLEAFPLAIIEAMAKGLPVAATSVNGIPEALGDTGCLLPDPHRDPEGVARALADTIRSWASDESLRRAIGARCRERALERFTEARMTDTYLGLVARLVD